MGKEKKAKELIPKTARNCNISDELANDIVDFFYTRLRKKIEDFDEPTITIPVLGRLVVNKKKLDKSIDKLCSILKELKEPTGDGFKAMKKYNHYKQRLDKQIDLQSKINRNQYELEQRKRNLGK